MNPKGWLAFICFLLVVSISIQGVMVYSLLGPGQKFDTSLLESELDSATSSLDDIGDNQKKLLTEKFAQEPTLSQVQSSTDIIKERELESRSMFEERLTVSRNVLIDLVSTLGTSVIRDKVTTTGSASVPQDALPTGEIQLNTGTTADSKATLETIQQGRYTPGQSAQIGLGVRTLEAPVNSEEWRAGYFDDDSGFYFGQNSTCLYVAKKSGGTVDQKVCRSNWNGQDVNDEINREWNITDGAILQIDYAWYGYGPIRFSIVDTKDLNNIDDIRTTQKTVPVHVFTNEGSTTISDPIQPLRAEVENGATGGDYELRVGGRQYSVLGDETTTTRETNDGSYGQSVAGSTFECVVAFQKGTGFSDENTEVLFKGLEATTTGANTEFTVLTNPNLTSENYSPMTNTPSTESALESDTSCTFASATGQEVQFDEPNGTEITSSLIAAGGKGNAAPGGISRSDLNLELISNRPVAIGARSTDGTTVTVSALGKFVEKR